VARVSSAVARLKQAVAVSCPRTASIQSINTTYLNNYFFTKDTAIFLKGRNTRQGTKSMALFALFVDLMLSNGDSW
jgi:hypothetical protein